MARLVRTPAFIADFRSALRVREENWGNDGRLRYASLIRRALHDLVGNPRCLQVPRRADTFGYHLRHSRDGIPVGLRVQRPRHAVFFRLDGGGEIVRLLRLLHDRMLPDLWLPDPDDSL